MFISIDQCCANDICIFFFVCVLHKYLIPSVLICSIFFWKNDFIIYMYGTRKMLYIFIINCGTYWNFQNVSSRILHTVYVCLIYHIWQPIWNGQTSPLRIFRATNHVFPLWLQIKPANFKAVLLLLHILIPDDARISSTKIMYIRLYWLRFTYPCFIMTCTLRLLINFFLQILFLGVFFIFFLRNHSFLFFFSCSRNDIVIIHWRRYRSWCLHLLIRL